MIRRVVLLLVVIAAGAGIYYYATLPPADLVLTGIVTTHEVVVSPQITGRLDRLLVNEGDTVKHDQVLAVLAPDELMQEREFYSATAEGLGSQVQESQVALRLQEQQTRDSIAQAE